MLPGRALPASLARAWPVTYSFEDYLRGPWDSLNVLGRERKRKWRGFCVVTKQVAQHIRDNPACQFSELIVESRQLWTGINSRLFEPPANGEYRDLVTILSHPPLKSFELSLDCGSERWDNWCSFRDGLLRKALSGAKNLQDFRFYTSIATIGRRWQEFGNILQNWMSLWGLFPVNKWPKLRHFSLSRFYVKQTDLISRISALQTTLESLELSFLTFILSEGSYRDLMDTLRRKMGWRERPASDQPKLIALVKATAYDMEGVVTDVSRAVEDFVYRWGPDTFLEGEKYLNKQILPGKGTLLDVLDPMYEETNRY